MKARLVYVLGLIGFGLLIGAYVVLAHIAWAKDSYRRWESRV